MFLLRMLTPPTPEEDNSNLGVDPTVQRAESSSEETHTPSRRGTPKAKARPKGPEPKQPKTPPNPPPWAPSLRAVDHPVGPKVTESVVSVPPPRVGEGAAKLRAKQISWS